MRAWEKHSWIARSVPIDLCCCLALSVLKIASWSANVHVLGPPAVQHLKGLGRPGPMIVKCGAQMQESPAKVHFGRAPFLAWVVQSEDLCCRGDQANVQLLERHSVPESTPESTDQASSERTARDVEGDRTSGPWVSLVCGEAAEFAKWCSPTGGLGLGFEITALPKRGKTTGAVLVPPRGIGTLPGHWDQQDPLVESPGPVRFPDLWKSFAFVFAATSGHQGNSQDVV